MCYLGQICIIFGVNLAFLKIVGVTALSNGAIWDEFSEEHKHQSTIFNAQFALFKSK